MSLLLTTVSVSAKKPYKEKGTWDGTSLFADCAEHGDWDFFLLNDITEEYHVKTWLDKDGTLIRTRWHINATHTLYNENNLEKVATGKSSANWNFYFDEDEELDYFRASGVFWTFKVKGDDGFEFRTAGNFAFDKDDNRLFQHGLKREDFAEVCEYFAEP